MKAAIVQAVGKAPVYGDFAEPVAASGKNLVQVTAAALSHVAISRASGSHYTSSRAFPFVAGLDGVGRLGDGRRVYFLLPEAPYGSMAEKTIVPAAQCVVLPDGLEDVTAAAMVIPGVSSWAAYKERAKLLLGETVLVNGATGSAGRLAVQVAKHLGAGKVIATGQNPQVLQSLKTLGADVIIPIIEDADALESSFKEQFVEGIDVVIDYLWGRTAELLLIAGAKAGRDLAPIRYVQVGSISGENISLPSAVLRSSAITLMGSGMGSVPIGRYVKAIEQFLQAAVPARFEIVTKAIPLSGVGRNWAMDSKARIVFVP